MIELEKGYIDRFLEKYPEFQSDDLYDLVEEVRASLAVCFESFVEVDIALVVDRISFVTVSNLLVSPEWVILYNLLWSDKSDLMKILLALRAMRHMSDSVELMSVRTGVNYSAGVLYMDSSDEISAVNRICRLESLELLECLNNFFREYEVFVVVNNDNYCDSDCYVEYTSDQVWFGVNDEIG